MNCVCYYFCFVLYDYYLIFAYIWHVSDNSKVSLLLSLINMLKVAGK